MTATILAVAVVATAAATVGPVYFNAAGTSILQDTVRSAPASGQVVDVVRQTGLDATQVDQLAADVNAVVSGSSAASGFAAPIRALEFPGHLSAEPPAFQTLLSWRDGDCAQLTIVSGQCPSAAGQVIASAALKRQLGLRLGQQVDDGLKTNSGAAIPLTISGFYDVPNPFGAYWSARPYFVAVAGSGNDISKGPVYTDGLFTPRSTFATAASYSQGLDVVDLPLNPGTLTYQARTGVEALASQLSAHVDQAQVTTTIPTVLDAAATSQQALAVPVFLVTLQLLVLCWLLLFLLVTDAVDARGNEVALAKLRGLSRRQTVLFGLSEQLVLLGIALPVGALVGWLATRVLASAILRSGTPVPLVGLGWAAAGIAVAGGALAAVGAARRTLSRSVLAQWSHVSSAPRKRGWVLDAVVGVLAVAGLVELFVSGVLGNANHNPLALLAPGLIALTIALLTSRALPLLSKAFFARTARQGGLGGFLAMRQVARRPGAGRTTIALTTAFGLVTFTIAAWSVMVGNIHDVGWTQVGASQVLTVSAPAGQQLNTIVDKLDPSGANAVAVDEQNQPDPNIDNEQRTLLAVDPDRFAKVAYWRNDFAPSALADLTKQLAPPEPSPVTLTGDQMIVTAQITINTGADGAELYAAVQGYQASGGFSPVDLGPVGQSANGTFTGQLPNCAPNACTLRQLYLEPQLSSNSSAGTMDQAFAGTLAISGISAHDDTGWHPVDAGLGTKGHWALASGVPHDPSKLSAGSGRLVDNFSESSAYTGVQANPAIAPVDAPAVLPAIMTGTALGPGAPPTAQTFGVDDKISLNVRPVTVATALPGAGTDGLIVDRDYAELASTGVAGDINTQVWLAPTAPADFAAKLRAAGVTILTTSTATGAIDTFSRQGPALALDLFLADAAAAAILAAGGAVLGMHLAGRRRTHEMAALVATGARKRSLGNGLLIEQGMTLGFGALFGIGAGLLATVLAVPSIPEFVNLPPGGAAPLIYHPSAGQLSTFLGIAVVLLAVAALASAATLIRAIRPDQLREAAP
ncbi:MAG TPA: FtsX-like permease family protein [Pseudonocardiaceae bacterium]